MRYHAKDRPIAVEDAVLFEKKRKNKLSPSYESQPFEVGTCFGEQGHPKESNTRGICSISKRVAMEPVVDAECRTLSQEVIRWNQLPVLN